MSDVPRQTLRDLIARHGPDLCGDARRCEALLRDLCGGHRREINILIGALRERVPLDLLAARRSMPRDLLLARLAKRLEDHLALTADAARWAVESWALALGVLTDAELEESRRSPVKDDRAETPKPTPATQPPVGADAAKGQTATRTSTPQPAPPPQRPTAPAPPVSPAPRATANPPPRRANPSPAGGPLVAAPRPRTAPPPHPPTAPPKAGTGKLQAPGTEPAARGGRRWRGCLIGCAVLLLLSALLVVGAPYVFNLLREEQQQQRNLEPPPAQSQ